MKRAGDSTQALVYAYCAAEPSAGLDAVMAEAKRCRALWDMLVEIDRVAQRVEQERACADDSRLTDAIAKIIAIKAELEPLYEQRAKLRAAARKKVDGDPRIKELSDQRATVRREIWALLSEWRKGHKDAVREIEDERRRQIVLARQNSGMYWGNYNRVISDFDRSRILCRKTGKRLNKSDEDREDGCLEVQIQSTGSGMGASPDEVMDGKFAPLHVRRVDGAAHDDAVSRGERKRLARTTCRMRIDAAGEFAEFPVVLHRPLPGNCRVKKAQLTWRVESGRRRWQLALTVTMPKVGVVHPRSDAVCGIDLGWRMLDGGALRIGVTATTDGRTGSIELSEQWMRSMDLVHALKGRVDENDLAETSREAREMNGLRRRLIGNRREHYRLTARAIAMRYGVVAVDDCDLGGLAKGESAVAGGMRVRACLSDFMRELVHQCAKHGAELLKVEGSSTTTCHACGAHVEARDRSDMIWTCHSCGAVWDQDENAARNLMLFAASHASGGVTNEEEGGKINDLRERGHGLKGSARKKGSEPALLRGST